MWGSRPFPATVSFKRPIASTGGDQELARKVNNQGSPICNTILQVQGLLHQHPVTFLLDSGAAVSVVHYDKLPPKCADGLSQVMTDTSMVGANGQPLEVVGQVELPVTVGKFKATHEFVVVQHLSVDCLLGADFLLQHKAVIDCGTNNLQLDATHTPITSVAPI